jgi:hypothetical protein
MERIEKRLHRIGHVEAYEVFADELETIERGYSSRQNDLTVFGVCFSTFLAFLLALVPFLLAGEIPKERVELWLWVRQTYLAVTVAGGGMSAYFLQRWLRATRRERPIFLRIRDRAIEPVGQEGKEIKATELAVLPAQERAEN